MLLHAQHPAVPTFHRGLDSILHSWTKTICSRKPRNSKVALTHRTWEQTSTSGRVRDVREDALPSAVRYACTCCEICVMLVPLDIRIKDSSTVCCCCRRTCSELCRLCSLSVVTNSNGCQSESISSLNDATCLLFS